jgi:hypothetical protein
MNTYIVLSVFMLSFIFGLFRGSESVQFFYHLFIYVYGDPIVKREWLGTLLITLKIDKSICGLTNVYDKCISLT